MKKTKQAILAREADGLVDAAETPRGTPDCEAETMLPMRQMEQAKEPRMSSLRRPTRSRMREPVVEARREATLAIKLMMSAECPT